MNTLFPFPFTNGERISIRDSLIHVLCSDWPLSAKKVYFKVRKQYNINCTYQAVHKVLQILVSKNVVAKDKNEYLINLNWLENNIKLLGKTKLNYIEGKKECIYKVLWGITDFREIGNTKIYEFDNFYDADWFRIATGLDLVNKTTDRILYDFGTNIKLLYIEPSKLVEWVDIQKDLNMKLINLIRNDSAPSRFASKLYMDSNPEGIFIKVGKGINNNTWECRITGDHIIETHVPEDINERITKLFSRTKRIEFLDIKQLYEILKRKSKITLTIQKNPILAQHLKTILINKFDEKDYKKALKAEN